MSLQDMLKKAANQKDEEQALIDEQLRAMSKIIEAEVIPEGKPGGYRALRLRKVIRPKGDVLKPAADGYFYPETEWDKQELEYFVTQGLVLPAVE